MPADLHLWNGIDGPLPRSISSLGNKDPICYLGTALCCLLCHWPWPSPIYDGFRTSWPGSSWSHAILVLGIQLRLYIPCCPVLSYHQHVAKPALWGSRMGIFYFR